MAVLEPISSMHKTLGLILSMTNKNKQCPTFLSQHITLWLTVCLYYRSIFLFFLLIYFYFISDSSSKLVVYKVWCGCLWESLGYTGRNSPNQTHFCGNTSFSFFSLVVSQSYSRIFQRLKCLMEWVVVYFHNLLKFIWIILVLLINILLPNILPPI